MYTKKENIASAAVILVLVAVFIFAVITGTRPDSFFNTITFGVEDTDSEISQGERVNGRDIVIGSGRPVQAGDIVSVHYRGILKDGVQFDSSYDRGEPLEFTVGSRQLIPGFEAGVMGMRAGGKREVVIPPGLGYGDRQAGPIPPNSTLIFTIELLSVVSASEN